MESLILATSEVKPQVSTSIYKLISLSLEWEQARIMIVLRGENNEIKTFIYGGPNGMITDKTKAINLMIALNKANLSVKSLHRRVIEQLISDGFISGTISGVPD